MSIYIKCQITWASIYGNHAVYSRWLVTYIRINDIDNHQYTMTFKGHHLNVHLFQITATKI